MEVARKLTGFIGKGPWGWKSLWLLTFFVGKGSATFILLPAAGIHHSCVWQVGQTLSHSEALAGMETQGKGLGWQTGSAEQRVLPLCFFICCHSPSGSPSSLEQCHHIIRDKKKEPTQNDPKMKQTKKIPMGMVALPSPPASPSSHN